MCGIVGIFDSQAVKTTSGHDSLPILQRMIKSIRHRGPDESGIHQENGIGLGSVRLSIIDLENGRQPMSNADGSIWLVLNGEIFNHIELRDELRTKGHIFRTRSDTEVLIHLYKEEGIEGLQKLNGQFAFAIWDRRKQELFLARDRVGIRPLFYTQSGGAFVFASEIKAILEHPDITPRLSPVALSQIFTLWTTLSPHTAFEGIYELPPGHYMKVSADDVDIRSYWQLSFPPASEIKPRRLEDAVEEFRALFADAVHLRLRADVPVAAYLSGGIDSCTTTAFIQKEAPNQLRTFSIGFTDKALDETRYQQQAAQYLGTVHTSVRCDHTSIARAFPDVIWHTETPILRTAPAPMYLLSKLVKESDIKVVITGEGADEMLAGYNLFKENRIRRFWARKPDSDIRPQLLRRLYPYLPQIHGASSFVLRHTFGYRLVDTASPIYSHLVRWHNTARIKGYFSQNFRARLGSYNPEAEIQEKLPTGFRRWHPLAQAQYLETTLFMSNYLLSSQGDRMAMANSVEGRYPFLDHRVIEFCANLPPVFKLQGLSEKYLLKQMMNGRLPNAIVNRSKQAYRAPIATSFLSDDAPEYVQSLLSDSGLSAVGIFEPQSVERLLRKAKSGSPLSETDQMALAGILSTQIWCQLFIQVGI